MDTENLSVSVHGNICLAEFPGIDNVCVRIYMVSQGEWKTTSGNAALTSSFSFCGVNSPVYIDLPFQFTMQGTSPFFWPRIVLNCFSRNSRGNETIVGYGCASIPSQTGKHSLKVHCYLPVTSSPVQWFIGKIRGSNVEFIDPLFPAASNGRYACQTSCGGFVNLDLNISVRSADNGFHFSSDTIEHASSFEPQTQPLTKNEG